MIRLRTLFVLAVALTAVCAFAQETFVIERIDVNSGPRIRPAIIRAETRLVAGHAYTAGQIEQAVFRVKRLPFITDATYTLAAGSSPSSHVLQINVLDHEAFNYDARLEVLGIHGSGGASGTDTLGYRFFPGATGVLDLTVGGNGFAASSGGGSATIAGIGARYSAYGLFGTSAYASVGLINRSGFGVHELNPSARVGVPLGLMNTIEATYSRTHDHSDSNRLFMVKWITDRTDDPFFARHGWMASAGPEWMHDHSVNAFNVGTRFEFHSNRHAHRNGAAALFQDFFPLAERSAAWGRVNLSQFDERRSNNDKFQPDVQLTNGEVLVGLAHNFDRSMNASFFRRARLEAGVGYHVEHVESRSFGGHSDGAELNVGFSYRSQWGVMHINLSYIAN